MVRSLSRLLMLAGVLTLPLHAERLDDSLSPQEQINVEFVWKHRAPNETF
jgi:hypothetical protein